MESLRKRKSRNYRVRNGRILGILSMELDQIMSTPPRDVEGSRHVNISRREKV